MRKIKCAACATTFNFHEEKNPNAKKVQCPKCRNVQDLNASAPPPVDDDMDWLKSPNQGFGNMGAVIQQDPEPIASPIKNDDVDDFFAPKPQKDAPVPPPRKPSRTKPIKEDEIGWLIIHDENTDRYTFDLRRGINRIGRLSESTPHDVNICIKTDDRYMSRHHCDIEVRWVNGKNIYEYILSDRKPSANGTFVNAGRRLNGRDEILLKDSDTVQVGRTKLVLKLPSAASNAQEAESWVRESDFFKTIIQ